MNKRGQDESRRTESVTRLDCETRRKRVASVYDAVDGRVGLSGFLTDAQRANLKLTPAAPEEVLLRRVGAPDQIPYDYYDADQNLQDSSILPDSDLLKAIHAYSADFYHANTDDSGRSDWRSFDETALLALGILLEEASKEVLGENGDMALTERTHEFDEAAETLAGKHQIIGMVEPRKSVRSEPLQEFRVDESQDEASPRKKQK